MIHDRETIKLVTLLFEFKSLKIGNNSLRNYFSMVTRRIHTNLRIEVASRKGEGGMGLEKDKKEASTL